jgi:transcriptional regulator with XRE-family HTH domain
MTGWSELPELGARIRRHRERRNMSLRELARRLGISASAISQIELGKSQPKLGTLYAVATELGLSLDELFDLIEPPRPRRRAGRSPA